MDHSYLHRSHWAFVANLANRRHKKQLVVKTTQKPVGRKAVIISMGGREGVCVCVCLLGVGLLYTIKLYFSHSLFSHEATNP